MKTITSKGKIWKYTAETASWYFVNLDPKAKKQVDELKGKRKGWGQVKVEVRLGTSKWNTCLFPSKEYGYVLPIKVSIRKKEGIDKGDKVEVKLRLI